MGNSIQDYLKKINSRLSLFDTASITMTAFFLLTLSFYFSGFFKENREPALYQTESSTGKEKSADLRPFGSRNGGTYTYSWCEGSDRIKPENKIYFNGASAAEISGRTLSKLCQK